MSTFAGITKDFLYLLGGITLKIKSEKSSSETYSGMNSLVPN